MLSLPETLERAIRQQLGSVPDVRWMREAQALSERYRGERGQEAPLASGAVQALGYAALIMPATYAQLHGAMQAAALAAPSWQPHSMLDLGSGPGTALWAASERWPSLEQFTAWEREAAFIDLGRQLASGHSALHAARWERRDLQQAAPNSQFDLVVLGHVLNELAPETQRSVVDAAWAATRGLLLIVEPGTPIAFAVVRAARDQLLEQAHTLAPCTHNATCPLSGDWCHFPQRITRPDFQRKTRGALSSWEDSKFSYAALARFVPEQQPWGRVIREPTWNKAYAEALISSRDGIVLQRDLKRHKDAFKRTKELRWGETLDTPPNPPDA